MDEMRRVPLFSKVLPVSSRTFARFRELCAAGFSGRTGTRLVRALSGRESPTGRETPSRREAGTGLVLYALLVPFGVRALVGRYWVTGSLLTAIGLVGCLGIVLRNLGSPSPKDGPGDGGPT